MKLSTFDALKRVLPEGSFTLTDKQVRQLQQTLLSMLRDIMNLARENGITVTLGGGSALGAVRYGGFIPWDDDIDLNVPRADYDRLIKLLEEQRPDRYWIHAPDRTRHYALLSTRIRQKGTDVRMREDAYSDECGASIDVFPIENTFDSALLRRLHGLCCMGLGFLLSCRKFFRDRAQMRAVSRQLPGSGLAFRVKIAVGFLVSWGSVDFWTRAADRCHRACHNSASRYISVPTGRKHFFGEMYRREEFYPFRETSFEGVPCLVPRDTDRYLRRLYGDYRSEPMQEERERHVYYSFRL